MKAYEVKFSGLKNGIHSFEFEIGKAFFNHFNNGELANHDVEGGELNLTLQMEKKETMLLLDFALAGKVFLPCSVCNDRLDWEIESTPRIVGKFSNEELWHEDDVIHIGSHEHKIDLSELIYQFICLEIPMRVAHDEGKCNSKVLEELEKRRITESDEADPRWAALKNLK
ncbi:MAG: DUF177 domain-containing protein [Flavobacteriales bacterium]|nr:DUF177 domain-containing protein [Flavobacteriales bacterium]